MTIDDSAANLLILAARACLALVFLVSGIHKGIYYQKAVGEFQRDKIPAIWLTLPGTIGLHLIASTCLMLGYQTREAALALAREKTPCRIHPWDFCAGIGTFCYPLC